MNWEKQREISPFARVAAGRLKVAFTDTDDVNVALRSGKPVRMVFPDVEGLGTLLIPNTVALVAGGPDPENGRVFIDFLLSREVEELLARSGSVQTTGTRSLVASPPASAPTVGSRSIRRRSTGQSSPGCRPASGSDSAPMTES